MNDMLRTQLKESKHGNNYQCLVISNKFSNNCNFLASLVYDLQQVVNYIQSNIQLSLCRYDRTYYDTSCNPYVDQVTYFGGSRGAASSVDPYDPVLRQPIRTLTEWTPCGVQVDVGKTVQSVTLLALNI